MRAPSPPAHGAHQSSHGAWDEAAAPGVAPPSPAWVAARRGSRPLGVRRTSPTTGGAPHVLSRPGHVRNGTSASRRAPVHGVSGVSPLLGAPCRPLGCQRASRGLATHSVSSRRSLLTKSRVVSARSAPRLARGNVSKRRCARLSPPLEAWAACLDAAYRGSMASLEQHLSYSREAGETVARESVGTR